MQPVVKTFYNHGRFSLNLWISTYVAQIQKQARSWQSCTAGFKSLCSPPSDLSQGLRQVVYLGYPATNTARRRKAESSRVSCSNDDGGDGGGTRGAGKYTAAEEPGRPRKFKVLAGKLTFEAMSQLAGPAALFAGLYCVSRSADFRAVGQGRDYRAPPLGETFASLRDHITLERPDARDTFSMCLLATAAGAGVSHATGQDTTGTVLAGLASFSIAMWASSRCRKGM